MPGSGERNLEWFYRFFAFDIWGFYYAVFVGAGRLLATLGLDPSHPLSWVLLLLVVVLAVGFVLRPAKPSASVGKLLAVWLTERLAARRASDPPSSHPLAVALTVVGAAGLRWLDRAGRYPFSPGAALLAGGLLWWGGVWLLTPPPGVRYAGTWGTFLVLVGLWLGSRQLLRLGVRLLYLLGVVGVIALLAWLVSGETALLRWLGGWF